MTLFNGHMQINANSTRALSAARGLFGVGLLVLLACNGAATRAQTSSKSDLVIVDARWGKVVGKMVITDRGTISVPPDARLRPQRPGLPPPRVLLQREAYILVRNDGPRSVKAVSWAFIFYEDRNHERELRRVEFTSKERVKPGEMKFLEAPVEGDAPTPYASAVISHVDYEERG